MKLSTLFTKRPVFTIVLSLLLVIFGFVSLMQLGIREFPEVDPPIVTVNTVYKGASSDIIQSQITEPLEESISGIDGIRVLSSVSSEQSSSITVEFVLGTNLEAAANDVRDRVSKAIKLLPKDVDPPVVEKMSANANPILILSVKSKEKNIMDVSFVAQNMIKERLQTIPGVAKIIFFGEKKYAMRLWLDPYKMTSKGITASDIYNSIAKENIELPSGRIESDNTELSIRTLGLMSKPEEYNNLIIKQDNGNIIRFSDVGYAELGPENFRTSAIEKGHEFIALGILPQQGANSIEISDEFYKRMESIKKEIPKEYEVATLFDFTRFERNAVKEVQETIIITLFFVVMVIFIFLRDWRSTIIPVVAIPISIIATFTIMALAGLSINVLTLLGIVLAIGLVCDDAIVVLENIYSKIDLGLNRTEAAAKGMEEIFFSVISTTITLAAVFLPIMFLQGLTGKLFREFAIVIAGSVLLSAVVALTLSPMMCSRILKQQRHLNLNLVYRITEPFFLSLNRGYRYSLKAFIERRWLVFPLLAFIAFLIYFFGTNIHSELAPFEDRCNIRIPIRGPEGTSYQFTERYLAEISKYADDSIPEIFSSFSVIAPSLTGIDPVNSGMHLVYLVDPEERHRSQHQILQKLNKDLAGLRGIRMFPFEPPTIGDRFGGQPVQFVLLAPNIEELKKVLPKFLEEARNSEVLQFVDANLKINKPEMQVRIDRDKAAQLNVSTFDIARTLQLTYSTERYGYFVMNGKQYEIIGQVMAYDRDKPSDLKNLYVRDSKANLIPLTNLINIEENISPSSIFTYNRYVSATVSAGVTAGYTLGDGIHAMNEVAKKVLPNNFTTSLAGQSRDFKESSSSIMFIFALSVVLIFLILAAQFESFRDPLIILFTVPLAVAGALFSLWYFNQTINVFSQIGIIMLIGLVTKNGILIVEFANQRKEGGMKKIEAVQSAAVSRLRPILMTSFAMIFGVLPIALSLGASAQSRQSLGIAVVGGLLFSTLLSLYIIPILYTYISKEKREEGE